MNNQKLKPCPFCGGASLRFDTDTVHPDNIHMAWVECNGDECECRGPRAFWFDDMSEAKANAAELWNKRAAPPAPVDDLVMLIRRLVHALKKSNPDNKLITQVSEYMQRSGYWQATDCLRSVADE